MRAMMAVPLLGTADICLVVSCARLPCVGRSMQQAGMHACELAESLMRCLAQSALAASGSRTGTTALSLPLASCTSLRFARPPGPSSPT